MRPLGTLAATMLVLGCTSPLPSPPYAQQPSSALDVVPFPPPPARPEIVPKQPAEAAVWIDGEWTWRGRRWGWTAGRWVIGPPGASFCPWTTVRSEDGTLYFAKGVWRDASGQAMPEPAALALGTSGAATSSANEPKAAGSATPAAMEGAP